MLRRDYSDYREAMRNLFNEVDPVGLIEIGAPDDEYEREIHLLLKWRRPVTPAEVAETFERSFESAISPEDARTLAAGIDEIRTKFGYASE